MVLPCQTVGNPKPELIWFDPFGQVLPNNNADRMSVLPDGALRIRSIVWNDMGTYTCMSRNSMGQDSVETFLYPMRVSNFIHRLYIKTYNFSFESLRVSLIRRTTMMRNKHVHH